MFEKLKEQIKQYSTHPGVYIMKNDKGEVIYVGKAKNLKNRVRTYFAGGDGRPQIAFLVNKIHSIETIVTDSESQAFILERDLITKYKPRYNIRLKDDKSYLSIRIDENSEWPRLELVRRPKKDGASYYGPYTYGHEVRSLLDVINKSVPLRTCSDTVFYNRQRPCLEYQIKRCAGPCCLEINPEEYSSWLKEAKSILSGKTEDLLKELELKMEQASADLRFEEAGIHRDRIKTIQTFRKGQEMHSSGLEDRDVFAIYREEKLATLSVLHVRNGRISNSTVFYFNLVEVEDSTLVESALEQFYAKNNEIPEEIVLPFELENIDFFLSLVKEKSNKKITITVPKRGIKARLLGLATLNAKENFLTKFNSEERYQEAASTLSKICKLNQIPRRIECIDISNMQESNIVGVVVSFFDGKTEKNNYKKYKIKLSGKANDFASIYQVVHRRLKQAMVDVEFPDLIIIDGGKGQLNAACEARDELGLSLDIIALAKDRGNSDKPERLFIEGDSEPKDLILNSPIFKLVTKVRDEAHRFAITFHRNSSRKRVGSSILDIIPGIGPERKARLLRYYGSIDRMKLSSVEELAQAGRMPKGLAQKIKDL